MCPAFDLSATASHQYMYHCITFEQFTLSEHLNSMPFVNNVQFHMVQYCFKCSLQTSFINNHFKTTVLHHIDFFSQDLPTGGFTSAYQQESQMQYFIFVYSHLKTPKV